MRKSKIILSLLIISLLTSKTWAVKAATSGTDENEINTKISTQADEQAGETDTTERSLVFTPTPSSTKLNEGEEITITLELSDIKMGQDGIIHLVENLNMMKMYLKKLHQMIYLHKTTGQ